MPKHDTRAAQWILSPEINVSSITITKRAEDAILRACRDAAAESVRQMQGRYSLASLV
jgi:hypothetical protein